MRLPMERDAESMFALRKVTLGYFDGEPIVRDVDLVIEKGDYILLKGPSGSGKSTFLRLLNGLVAPQSGEVLLQGQLLTSYDPPALRRRIVYLQQSPVMLDASVRDNLCLAFRFRSARGATAPDDETLKEYLHGFRLDGVSLEGNARNLSVGQKQRLALIRALLLKPEALLLDEPTASLDPESREVVEQRVEALHIEEGVVIVMVSHTDYYPKRAKPRVLILENGSLREVAT